MNGQRVLIAGIGNIFFGDDAFGVEAARQLQLRPMPDGVRVVDFGIRGLDLAYALTDGCDLAILVDAVRLGEPAGTLYVIEPDVAGGALPAPQMDGHALDPWQALGAARALGPLPKVFLVGCEPGEIGPESGAELSAPVQAAVGQAVALIESWAAAGFDALGRQTTNERIVAS